MEIQQFIIDIIAGLATCYLLLVLYLRQGWKRLTDYPAPVSTPSTRVSVLIAARNEGSQIAATIEDVLAQNYPRELMELIIVDDHSTDNTAEIVERYAGKGVRLIRLREERLLNSYKKKAISEAIKLAKGELLVVTDADCRMSTDWLRCHVDLYEREGFVMISGPVIYHQEQNLFEEMQTLEFLYLIGLGAATIGQQMPATCNGANLAYSKAVFQEVGGFSGIDHLASGDDELLLHKIAAVYPGRIGFCKSREAVVYTTAKANLREFIRQRKRWASKSTRYKDKWVVFLGVMIWLFNASIIGSVAAAFFYPHFVRVLLVTFLVKLFAELVFLQPVCRFAGRLNLLWYLPLLSILHALYLVYIGIAGNTGKYEWKGRRVN